MGIFNSINISASGLTAEKTRIDIISMNLANASTTKTTGGTPYRRKLAVYHEQPSGHFKDVLRRKIANGNIDTEPGGVKISKIIEDQTPYKLRYEPGHPEANDEGYVEMPNVDTVKEMVDLIGAQRGYDANVTAINSSKSMLLKALEIGRR